MKVPLCQRHCRVKANHREQPGHVQNRLDHLFPYRGIQVIKLSGVVPWKACAVVAVVNVARLSALRVAPPEHHRCIRLLKVVVLNFWATWCEPCQVEIPWMIEFQQKYEARGFTVLGVAMDDEGKSVVEPFVAKKQFDVDGHSLTMNYPIVLGNDDLAAKFGGLIGLPTSLVISRDGRLVKRFIGLVNHDTIVKEIEGQL